MWPVSNLSVSPTPLAHFVMSRQRWLPVAFVGVDAIVKLAAFLFLQPNQPIKQCLICVVLRINYSNLGSAAQSLVRSQGELVLVRSTFFSLFFANALLVLSASGHLKRLAVTIVFICTLIISAVFSGYLPKFGGFSYSTIAATSHVAGTFLWVVIWIISTSTVWRISAFLFAAAGASNSLSLLYPPYHVVDYLWSSPLNHAIGVGVFNIADVLWLFGWPVLGLALLMSVVPSAWYRRRRFQ